MGKPGLIVLGLALLAGSLAAAGYRHLATWQPAVATRSAPSPAAPTANRSIQAAPPASAPTAARPPKKDESLSGFQIFEMGLNVANVVVGLLGIWLTVRGIRIDRQGDAMAMRRER